MADPNLPPAGKLPVNFLFPAPPPKKGQKAADGVPAAGLFVLWSAIPVDTQKSADPSTFKLGFCGETGVLFDVSTLDNPWPIALKSKESATKLGAVAEHWTPQNYDVVFVAHPSPVVARAMLTNLQKGLGPDGNKPADLRAAWRMQLATPRALKRNLVVDVKEDPAIFMPGGPSEYGGWLLYRRMPYQLQTPVKAEVSKLVFHLSRLRYPAACSVPIAGAHVPYTASETEHAGVFDAPVQATLHRFQKHLAAGTTFKLTDAGRTQIAGTTDIASWGYLRGADATQKPVVTEEGVVDAATAKALTSWFDDGLRKPGPIVVQRGKLWAQPELWYGFTALDLILQGFSARYRLAISNTYRVLPSSGPGQVETSFHKLGRAIDLETTLGDPSDGFPVGYEGDWVTKNTLKWLVYIHSGASATPDPAAPLVVSEKVASETKAFMTTRLGEELPAEANEFLEKLTEYVEKLNKTPQEQLHQDYLRESISRFQWQSGEDDGGNAQTAITAAEDAQRNSRGAGARSWVNLSRHAFHTGLFSISAHEDKLTVSDEFLLNQPQTDPKKKKPKGSTTRDIAISGSRLTPKAMHLDDLAESIRRAIGAGIATITAKTPEKKLITVPVANLRLPGIGSWIARVSDRPDVLAPPPSGFSFANGVDLTMEIPIPMTAAAERFMTQRAAIKVKVLSVGKGLQLKAALEPSTTMAKVLEAAKNAKAVTGEKDHAIVVRPDWADELVAEGDPGTFVYTVPRLGAPAELEWWHFELQHKGDKVLWHDLADALGLDRAVLAAPEKPQVTTAGPIFVGGADMAIGRPLGTRQVEPGNSVTSLERPA
jgi:hypothetical protein